MSIDFNPLIRLEIQSPDIYITKDEADGESPLILVRVKRASDIASASFTIHQHRPLEPILPVPIRATSLNITDQFLRR